MAEFEVVGAEEEEGPEVMVLFQLIMRMEAGIATWEIPGGEGAEEEEEDVVSVVVEGEDTMDLSLICSKMVDTTKMYLLKDVVVAVAGVVIVEGVVALDPMGQSRQLLEAADWPPSVHRS